MNAITGDPRLDEAIRRDRMARLVAIGKVVIGLGAFVYAWQLLTGRR